MLTPYFPEFSIEIRDGALLRAHPMLLAPCTQRNCRKSSLSFPRKPETWAISSQRACLRNLCIFATMIV
jgi:hypothetical protein